VAAEWNPHLPISTHVLYSMKSRTPVIALILGSLAFLSSLHAVPLKPKTFVVTTLMKSGSVGLFSSPIGITADSKGNLYVADQGNFNIRKIDTNLNVTTIASEGTNAQLIGRPYGITTDSQGNLFEADNGNNTICKIDSNNNVTRIAGKAFVQGSSDGQGTNATFNNPTWITTDNQGNLYVTDAGNNTIRKIDSSNNVTTIAGQAGIQGSSDGQGTNATFNSPSGITVDNLGNLYVTDGAVIRKIDTNLNVTTIAGGGAGFGVIDGQGTNATFDGPQDITLDSQGNLFVTDGNSVRKIDTNLNVTTIAGQANVQGGSDGQGTNATFNYPEGITLDGQGNLFVADRYNSTIRKIDTNLNVTTISGKVGVSGSSDGPATNADYFDPTSITLDGQGNLFVADNGNKTIWEIGTNDSVIPIAGQPGIIGSTDGQGTNASFTSLSCIAADSQGNLFVADNQTVRKINSNNNVTTLAGQPGTGGSTSTDGQGTNATFSGLTAITVDSQGNLYVYDDSTIRKIDSNNNVTTLAGQAGAPGGSDGQGTNATFNSPSGISSGITVDNKGNLYVADTGDSTIRKIDTNLNVTTIAGRANKFGFTDGKGTNARFGYPSGITIDSQGNLYVTDVFNIRKIDTNLNVTTIAGRLGVKESSDGQGTNATFNSPRGIVVDGRGDFYISDTSTIREAVFLSLTNQTISFKSLPAKAYGDASFSLNATASSGLPVSYTSSNTNVVVISSNTVTIVGVGSATITANQLGDTNYATAVQVNQILKVAKGTQSINFGKIPAKTYASGTTFSLGATNSSGLPVTYTSSNTNVATVSGSLVTITGAGNSTITASQTSGNANFKAAVPVKQVLTVAKATQFLMFMTPPTESFVQGNTFSLSAMAMSGSNLPVTFKSSSPGIISIHGTTATIHAVGKVTLTANQAGNANYLPAVSTAVVTVQLTP